MGSSNEYMRTYLLKRYYRRKEEAFNILGNKCKCGSIEHLEIDHINRKDKEFTLTKLWGCNHNKFLKELAKCQLLCSNCHKEKTLQDLGKQNAKLIHGTLSSYRYCKCKKCKLAKSQYMKRYRIKRLSLR